MHRRRMLLLLLLLLAFLHGLLQFVQVTHRVVVHEQDVFLGEGLLADVALEGSVGVEVFVQGVIETQIVLS